MTKPGMELQQRINAFAKLGAFMAQFSELEAVKHEHVEYNERFFDAFRQQLKLAGELNGWFTPDNMAYALASWSRLLTESELTTWLAAYDFKSESPRTVAIVMPGNIPLVGFHDLLCVLIAGHKVLVKQSSSDKHLLPVLTAYLESVAPGFKGRVQFTTEQLEGYDAIIATGSDNTARYFEYYFKDHPSIIRRNRNSVAILTGEESPEDLQALSEDVFRYFGLGCRSVSKLFVPRDFDFDPFFNAMYHWHPIMDLVKYANNYDYNKAIYLMSESDMLDNGFLMLKRDAHYGSPIATVFYEEYENKSDLEARLTADADKIQCLVANGFSTSEIPFGKTQSPCLSDYADGVDTIEFLSKL